MIIFGDMSTGNWILYIYIEKKTTTSLPAIPNLEAGDAPDLIC